MTSLDLTIIPQGLADRLGISLYAGELLASVFIMLIFLLPVLVLSDKLVLQMFVSFVVACFCVTIGWLDFYFLVMYTVLIALLYAGTVRKFITGE